MAEIEGKQNEAEENRTQMQELKAREQMLGVDIKQLQGELVHSNEEVQSRDLIINSIETVTQANERQLEAMRDV